MNILTNEKTILRNAKIGKYTSLAAFGLVAIGAYFLIPLLPYLNNPAVALTKEQEIQYWWFTGCMFGFLAVFQIGIYFMNRFGRRPRPDELINASLKGLTKDYNLYHYLTPVNHLLVGPAGVWIIEPYYQRGTISYEGGRWQQKGGGLLLAYMKIFMQEGLGRPDLEIKADVDSLTKALSKALGADIPAVNVALVFTDPRAELAAENAPSPTIKVKELKETLRRYAKEHPFPAEQIKGITDLLPDESIE